VYLKCLPIYESTSFKGAAVTEYLQRLPEIPVPVLWVVGEKSDFM